MPRLNFCTACWRFFFTAAVQVASGAAATAGLARRSCSTELKGFEPGAASTDAGASSATAVASRIIERLSVVASPSPPVHRRRDGRSLEFDRLCGAFQEVRGALDQRVDADVIESRS